MKSVNPLHIVLLLLVLLIFLLVKLSGEKEALEENKQLYQETLALATSLKALNDTYSDKKDVKRSISIILKQHSLKSAKIQQTVGKSSIVLSSKSVDKIALNSLMSKIFNGSYNVHSLKIKRLNETHASFSMEIQW